jgi:hypothetical protein
MPDIVRFDFHGAAAAFGGRICCPPKDIVLETAASAALTVSGGRSRGAQRGVAFDERLRIGAAAALAEGLFDPPAAKRARGRSTSTQPRKPPTATTTVRSEVRDVTLAVGPTLRAKLVRASLTARSPQASGEAAIALGDDTAFDGITIGRARLKVEINRTLFEQFDTRAKLLTACDDPRFVREHGSCLFLGEGERQAAPPYGRGLAGCSPIRGTIVRALAWEGQPPPDARIEGHTVVVAGLGRIAFGEILIAAASRRLTMIRVEFDCEPCGGMMALVDVQDNGSWS